MRRGAPSVRWWSSLASGVLLATLLVVVGASDDPLDTPDTAPAAGSTYLCTSYSGCRKAGYSDDGYGSVNGKMYWRMYSGHNCTNYAAYRMIRAGMSTSRPWSGSGMAYNWGKAMSRITDGTPAVGAIAWWDRYHNGIGSSGHVAYVEKVVSATEIVISEDSWGGTFSWRRITKSSGRWPSGFIHFKDVPTGPAPLVNTLLPAITGTPQVGLTLTASTGTWTPAPRRYTYQWRADGVAVAGATRSTYVPTSADLGKQITVTVTAYKSGRTPVAASSGGGADVAPGQIENAAPPVISGTPVVDETLSVRPGSWAPAPGSVSYLWRAGGQTIPGATAKTLEITPDMAGKIVAVVEMVSRPGFGEARYRSARTSPVLVGRIQTTRPVGVTGRPEPGHTLKVVPGAYSPSDVAVTYTWLRDGVPIPGATGPTYVSTVADLGSIVSVRAALAKRTYLAATDTAAMTAAVRARPAVAVAAAGRRHAALVRVRVGAAGANPVSGTVTVRIARRSATVRLVNGRARVWVSGVAPGRRLVRVVYGGSDEVLAARGRKAVRVHR